MQTVLLLPILISYISACFGSIALSHILGHCFVWWFSFHWRSCLSVSWFQKLRNTLTYIPIFVYFSIVRHELHSFYDKLNLTINAYKRLLAKVIKIFRLPKDVCDTLILWRTAFFLNKQNWQRYYCHNLFLFSLATFLSYKRVHLQFWLKSQFLICNSKF